MRHITFMKADSMKTCVIQTFWRVAVAFAILVFSAGVHADDGWLMRWKVESGRGNVESTYKIAKYYMARGIYKAGIDWYTNAAEHGHAQAEYELADMYMNGDKVAKSFDTALYWYRRSASNGNAYAQAKLGHMYEHGGIIEKNPVQALRWLKLAVANGNLDAALELNELESSMTQEQIAEAESLIKSGK